MYLLESCTWCTHVHSLHLYLVYACTCITPVPDLQLYLYHTCTWLTLVPALHLYLACTLFFITPVSDLHLYPYRTWVLLLVTHGASAGCFIKLVMGRRKKISDKFTILSHTVVIAYLQKLHHGRKLESCDFFLFFYLGNSRKKKITNFC